MTTKFSQLLRGTLPLFTAASAMAQTADRPNIIFFLVDDMGWQDTSLPFWTEETPQNHRYHTPNMERLAKQGVMFTNAYACPVSSPSRSSLISGMNAARHGVTNWIESYDQNTNASGSSVTLPDWNWNGVQPAATATPTDRTHSTLITPLPQLLHDAGYMTIHCGKGNFGAANTSGANPSNFGFDVNIAGGYAGGPGSYLAQDNYGSAIQRIGGLEEYAAQGIFLTEALTQEAIKNLNHAVESDSPFYLYMSHYAIHTPYNADTRFTGNYTSVVDEQFGTTLTSSEVNRAALIEGMDKSLGDLMDWLDNRPDVAANTIILFMSDNGGQGVSPRQGRLNHDPNYPSRGGKGSGYDGGVHEPMIVSWPNVVGVGTKNENRVMIEDFFPTILEMAGVTDYQTVQTVDGKSFVDLLRDPSLSRDRAAIWHYPNRWGESADRAEGYSAWSAIMKGDYHLLYFWENQERRLYNIREDISEEHNLADEMPELAMQLAQELTDSLKSYGARRPTLATTGTFVPWPSEGQMAASEGDAMNVGQLGIKLSTQEGEKYLYYVVDARNSTSDEGGPFYWALGKENNYPAIQCTTEKWEGEDAQKQLFYFMQGSDDYHLRVYTADGKPVSYTEGTTRSGYSTTDQVTASYLQYGVADEAADLQAIMTNYNGYYGFTVDGLYLSNRGSSHGAANNMGWVVMPYSGSSYGDRGCRFKFVSPDEESGKEDAAVVLPTLTTDESNPVFYRIRNSRFYAQGKASYALYTADNSKLSLTGDEDEATKFYFTGSQADGVVTAKIHNDQNANLMAGEASWNSEGCDWYIKLYQSNQGGIDATTGNVYSGVLICNNTEFKVNWYVGSSDTSIKLYDYKWDGNIFTLEEVKGKEGEQENLSAKINAARKSLLSTYNTAANYANYIGTDLNCYSQGTGDEDYPSLMAAAKYCLEGDADATQETLDKLNDLNNRIKAVLNGLVLNQPQAGSFLRLRSAKTLGYARSHDANSSDTDIECMSLAETPDDEGIFYYDGAYLINYLNGLYMDTNWLHNPGGVKSKMDFRPSAEGKLGTYYVVALDGSKGERNLMVNNSKNNVMYRSNYNSEYNGFWLETVNEVPFTIGDDGWGSLCLPMTAQLNDEQAAALNCFTAFVSDGTLLLSQLGNTIPAATPVLIQGMPGIYRLTLSYAEIGLAATNQLTGAYSTEYATGNELLWNGTTMEKATVETIPGFSAYMTADTGAEGLPSVNPVGIVQTIVPSMGIDHMYDLSGRPVNHLRKGIYIINNHKVVVR